MAKRRKENRVGRWGSYSADPTKVAPEAFEEAVAELLLEYGDAVYFATEDALDAAAYVLMEELREASPQIKNPPKGYKRVRFAKRWKTVGAGKYRLRRYVGNATTVTGKDGDPIALTNIFEYSTTRGRPFVKDTYEKSVTKMAAAAVEVIKKKV